MYPEVTKAKRHCANCNAVIPKGRWVLVERSRTGGYYWNKHSWCQACIQEIAERPIAGPPGRPRYPSDDRRIEANRQARPQRIEAERARYEAERARIDNPPDQVLPINITYTSSVLSTSWVDGGTNIFLNPPTLTRGPRRRPVAAPRTPDPEVVSAVLEEEDESIEV